MEPKKFQNLLDQFTEVTLKTTTRQQTDRHWASSYHRQSLAVQNCDDCGVQTKNRVVHIMKQVIDRRTRRKQGWIKQCQFCGKKWPIKSPFTK